MLYLPNWLHTAYAVALHDSQERGRYPIHYTVSYGGQGEVSILSKDGLTETPEGYGLFFVPNHPDPTKKMPKDSDIRQCCLAFVDVDKPVSLPPNLPRPHFVVHTSPGKFHAYWELTDPVTPEEFVKLQKALIAAVGSDESVYNPARLMRFPGSEHRKGIPFLTRYEEDITGIDGRPPVPHTPIKYQDLLGCAYTVAATKGKPATEETPGIFDPRNRTPAYPNDVTELVTDLEGLLVGISALASTPGDRHRKLLSACSKAWNRIYGLSEMGQGEVADKMTEKLITASASSGHREYESVLYDTQKLVLANPPEPVELTQWLTEYKLPAHILNPDTVDTPPTPCTISYEVWDTSKIASSTPQDLCEYLDTLTPILDGLQGQQRANLLSLIKTVEEAMGQGVQLATGLKIELEGVNSRPTTELDSDIYHGTVHSLQPLVDIWYKADVLAFDLPGTKFPEVVLDHAAQLSGAFDQLVKGNSAVVSLLGELLDRDRTKKVREALLNPTLPALVPGFTDWLNNSRYLDLFAKTDTWSSAAKFLGRVAMFPGVRACGVGLFTPSLPHGDARASQALQSQVHLVKQADPFVTFLAHNKPTEYNGIEEVEQFCAKVCGMLGVVSPESAKVFMGWTAQAYPRMVLGKSQPADYALIIHGEEGIGKTAIARALSGGFVSHVANFAKHEGSTLGYAQLVGSRIVNLTEGQVFKENKGESFKSFMDLTEVDWIPKYSNARTIAPATWLVIGSTNNRQYLKDLGTNRRVLALSSESLPQSFDHDMHLGQGKDKQLFLDFMGAAKFLYENGYTAKGILNQAGVKEAVRDAVADSIVEDANSQSLEEFAHLYESEINNPDSNLRPLLGETDKDGNYTPYAIPFFRTTTRGPLRWITENPDRLTEEHLKAAGFKQCSAAHVGDEPNYRKSSGAYRCRQFKLSGSFKFCPMRNRTGFEQAMYQLGLKMGFSPDRFGGPSNLSFKD